MALRLAAALLGAGAGFSLLGLLWPEADRSGARDSQGKPADLAKPPTRAITVLVIGADSDRLRDPLNRAAPPGPANADALLMVRVNPQGPLQVLTIPTNLAVQLPGQARPQSLGSLYRLGGPALTADGVRELVGLGPTEPDRFVVLSRGGLRQLTDGLGSVEASPDQVMRYEDRRQGLSIDLQAGLQRLRGEALEHLARYRDPRRPDESRQEQHLEVAHSLLRELAMPHQLQRLPGLSKALLGQVNTNLSEAELLSLLAAGLADPAASEWRQLPLAPPEPASGSLRQVAEGAPTPLWPAPRQSATQPRGQASSSASSRHQRRARAAVKGLSAPPSSWPSQGNPSRARRSACQTPPACTSPTRGTRCCCSSAVLAAAIPQATWSGVSNTSTGWRQAPRASAQWSPASRVWPGSQGTAASPLGRSLKTVRGSWAARHPAQ
jgi:LCP family protein required for cell wall assembly